MYSLSFLRKNEYKDNNIDKDNVQNGNVNHSNIILNSDPDMVIIIKHNIDVYNQENDR